MLDRPCLVLACVQAVARQGPEAVSVRLGAPSRPSQAQLDGFKSRALRAEAPTQRHLYTTGWLQVDVAGGAGAEVLMIFDGESVECEHLSSCVSHVELVTTLHNGEWTAIALAVSTQGGSLAVAPLFALEVALALVKTQMGTMPTPPVV